MRNEMSSYRSSYIPWQGSIQNSSNKQNPKDKYVSNTNTSRYTPRSSSYGGSSNNTKPATTTSSSSSPSTTPTYQYRKSSTPSILKKYANYTPKTVIDKKAEIPPPTNETQESKDSSKTSSIPRVRPFTKFAPYDANESSGLRYGSSSRFGSQIARSPIKDKSLPVFGISASVFSKNETREQSPEKLLLVTRATSPTSPSNSSFLRSRRMDNDNVLLSEIYKSHTNSNCQSTGTQTDENEGKAPVPPSRVASLTTKFLSVGSTNRYQPKVGGYNYTRPTDLPLRSSSSRSFHSPTERSSPTDRDRLSPSFYYNPPVRTPSPLAALNKSLSNLAIEKSKDDSDTENESSYEEHYPIKSKKEPYSFICGQNNANSELSDKPPKYPLSPNSKSKTMVRDSFGNDAKLLNIRSLSTSSNSSGKLDSSCEDISEKIYTVNSPSDKHIPVFNSYNDNNNMHNREVEINNNYKTENDPESAKRSYSIRKIDSGDAPWWLNSKESDSKTDTQEQDSLKVPEPSFGYRIRKMDSTDSPWWCKNSETESECNQESCSKFIESQKSNLSRSSDGETADRYSSGFAIRKMDSTEIPWWNNSEDDSYSSRANAETVNETSRNFALRKMDSSEVLWNFNSDDSKAIQSNDENCNGLLIRKFDSGETDWWADEKSIEKSSSSSVPEWLSNSKIEDDADGCLDYKANKVIRITKIEPVERIELNTVPSHYEIANNDFINRAGWLDEETEGCTKEDNLSEEENDNSNLQAENNYKLKYINELDNLLLYIGDHTNVDELLGTEVPPPAAPVTPTGDDSSDDEIGEGCKKVTAKEVKIHDGSAYTSTIHRRNPQLDDTALQLYKDGDYSSYLDLDSSIAEQHEEFEGFQPSRKDSIVVRTQLSVRVHLIIEKLMKSEGRELRRALFSLKQIFQEDKDLVHEFVQNDGLDCLIKVGSDVDQNYQNYILRALGQVMLYVDGMNGVMEHNPTIQWLYSLVSSKFRLVVKTALKLLLVFVEYVESNSLLLIQAIHTLNISQGMLPWSNIMRLLHEYDATDTELLIYAMTLINKTLNGIPDQDMYYDQVDLLEEQDMESVIRKYMSKQGTDLDLLRQFQIYEAVLQHEDGEDKCTPLKQLDETIRKTLRNRKSLTNGTVNNEERRKSRRHSTGTTAVSHTSLTLTRHHSETSSPEEYRIKPTLDGAGVTPGMRRRRERAERQRSLLREQYENNMRALMDTSSSEDGLQNGTCHNIPHVYVNSAVNKLESMEDPINTKNFINGDVSSSLKREATVKDITQKLATLQTPDDMNKSQNLGRVEEMKGIISKAMEGLAKSQSRCDILRSPSSEMTPSQIPVRLEPKKSETELHWEELLASSTRALQLCDLDFSDLKSDDEHDVLAPASITNGIPPPPPPCGVPPPVPSVPKAVANKGKKTVKLFWKEVREDPIVMTKLNSKQLIWDEMFTVTVDTQRLEHLFESRAKDLISKKQHELNKNKEIIVLDPKRSNAINIGMTKLPPPRSIKTAILKMDSTVMNREGIEKLLTMLPTEEERSKIQEAQAANPDLPLGTAEHFLQTLASISELTARLKLWSFKLNYENIEKEIADPLMDLKQGMELLRTNKTFRAILSTLLSIGIFLNGAEVKGFQVEYLSKVPEVKDTVHKHSLLHHLCHIVMEKFPESTDLYSEIGAITRASRVDFDELSNSIKRVEQECKASFDHLKAIAKHDGNTTVKLKISDFLADCAERIIALSKIHRRVLNRFYKFCLWLGIPLHRIQATKPNELCKIVSEFALEYRTTRERVIQQLEKKASHRERNKTRGKMITEVGKFHSKEDRQDAELRQLLGKEHSPEYDNANNVQCGSLTWRRQRKDVKSVNTQNVNGHLTDVDDELLETLVKTATKAPASRNAPRERKRTRHSDRKSLIPKRSRTRENMLLHGNLSLPP